MTQNQILQEIKEEREHQDKKWGGPDHDDLHSPYEWASFIITYLGQAVTYTVNEVDPKRAMRSFRYNMIKVASLAVAAIEVADRKLGNE
jgi:hypothetical protein